MEAELSRTDRAVMNYSKSPSNWITIGGHKSGDEKHADGTRVEIKDGSITKGPPGLKGETFDDLKDKSRHHVRSAKAAHAAASDKTGHDYSPSQAKALGADKKVEMHQAAKRAASGSGWSATDVMRLMPDAHKHLTEVHECREKAKAHLRKNIGLTAGDLARLENQYQDHSTVKNWDTAARDVAETYPELGFDPDNTDTPAKVWDMLREGKKAHIAMHSQEVADLATEWLRGSGEKTKRREPGDDEGTHSMARSDHGEAVPFSRIERAIARYGGYDPKQPRNNAGQWSDESGGGSSSTNRPSWFGGKKKDPKETVSTPVERSPEPEPQASEDPKPKDDGPTAHQSALKDLNHVKNTGTPDEVEKALAAYHQKFGNDLLDAEHSD